MTKSFLCMITGGLVTYLLVDDKANKKFKKLMCDLKHKIKD